MGSEMRGQRVEGLLDQFFIAKRTSRRAKSREPRRALGVAGEQTDDADFLLAFTNQSNTEQAA